MTALTPAMVAERWHCSERTIRNMVARGELRAFRPGRKLLRIPLEAVEAVECAATPSPDSGAASPSHGQTQPGSATATASGPLTRARLSAVRQRFTQS